MNITHRPARLFAALLLLSATPASAITVGLNSTLLLPGITLAQRPDLNGTSLAPNSTTVLDQPSPDVPTFAEARLSFDALREPGGGLLLTYRAMNLSTQPTSMSWSLTIANLPLQEFDTDVLLDSPGIPSTITVSRDAAGITTFTSAAPLATGQSSQTLFISLPWATQFRQAGLVSITTDFGPDHPTITSALGTGYAPLPEPAPALLLLLAAAGLSFRFRRSLK